MKKPQEFCGQWINNPPPPQLNDKEARKNHRATVERLYGEIDRKDMTISGLVILSAALALALIATVYLGLR